MFFPPETFEAISTRVIFESSQDIPWMDYFKSNLFQRRFMNTIVEAVSELIDQPKSLLRFIEFGAGNLSYGLDKNSQENRILKVKTIFIMTSN